MKYLSTFLLTSAILIMTDTYGGLFCCKESKIREEKGSAVSNSLPTAATSNVKAENFPLTSNESVINTERKGYNISDTPAIITQETEAAINNFYALVKENEECSISIAANVLFSPEIYPYISWRSDKKTDFVIDKLIKALQASLNIPESEIQSPPVKKEGRRRVFIPKKDSDRKKMSHNLYCIIRTFESIRLPDSLEKQSAVSYYFLEDTPKPSKLNELVGQTAIACNYSSLIAQEKISFTPVLQLKVYLELLHQSNITADSLGQILRATIDLTQMFMKDSGNYMLKQIQESKQSLIDSVSNNLYPPYYDVQIQELKELKNKEELNAQASNKYNYIFENFQNFDQQLETSVTRVNQSIDCILKSFGPEALELFREIFELIVNHPKSTQNVKKEAAELLGSASVSKKPATSTASTI